MEERNPPIEKNQQYEEEVKSTRKNLFSYQYFFIGIFWIASGLILLINSFFVISTKTALIVMVVFSMYLLLLASLKVIRKVYFVLGLLILAAFISLLVNEYGMSKLLWPTVMGILSVGIILYGFLFKKKNSMRYTVVGFVFIVITALVLLSSLEIGDFSLSELLSKLWPVLFVVIGLYNLKLLFSNGSANKKSQKNLNKGIGDRKSDNSSKK